MTQTCLSSLILSPIDLSVNHSLTPSQTTGLILKRFAEHMVHIFEVRVFGALFSEYGLDSFGGRMVSKVCFVYNSVQMVLRPQEALKTIVISLFYVQASMLFFVLPM